MNNEIIAKRERKKSEHRYEDFDLLMSMLMTLFVILMFIN